MLRKLAKEETGIALPIAIMLVVIVGVMGAGLLVFVTTDLGSVIESNQGQKAFNLADAGVQAAKAHLMTEAETVRYNGTTNLAATPIADQADSGWSCGAWNPSAKTCSATGKTLNNLDGTSGNSTVVWIQYLKPATSAAQANDSTGVYAPEVVPSGQTNYAAGKDYFKVISEGKVGSGGVRRKVEAIYNTYDLGVPQAYYTPGSIDLNGNAGAINNISLFAGGNVTGQGGGFVTGEDFAYGNWNKPPYNTTARGVTTAGIGALGTVANKVPGRDFDSTTTPKFRSPLSAAPPNQPTNEMIFPFNASSKPDIEAPRSAAQAQSNGMGGSNYYQPTGGTSVSSAGAGVTGPAWPANSTTSTVVFVSFTSPGALSWNVGSKNDPPVRGTLVVENGTFTTQPSKAPLRGAIIISGAGPGTLVYDDTGNTDMQSFVIASGDMKISGNVGAFTQERGNRPGFYGLNLWIWRELYQ